MNKKIMILLLAITLSFAGVRVIEVVASEFKEKDNKVDKILKSMSLDEKLEQLLIIDLPYVYENNVQVDFTKVNENVKEFFKTRKLGGIILFENNMVTPEQTTAMISEIQKTKDKGPFFISVDEEG